MDLLAAATALQPQLVADRRHLHERPETGFHTPDTAAYVRRRLTEMGIPHRDCGVIDDATGERFAVAGFGTSPACTGVVATIGQGFPCFLLRADMDALPLQEEYEASYASKVPGRMHACGHDAHTAMLLGAAQLLKEREAELRGTVKLMFQPGEEWGYGAQLMIDDGLLSDPPVDAAFALHVDPSAEVGTVGVHPGTASSAMDTFIVTITGVGGHSSEPQRTVDPVMIATQLYTQLNLLVTREADPSQATTFSIGALRAGTATNIIPETARLDANMRSQDPATRDHLCRRNASVALSWLASHAR